jgi:hypothetical protein
MSLSLRRKMRDLELEPLPGIPEDVGFRGSGGVPRTRRTGCAHKPVQHPAAPAGSRVATLAGGND